MNATHKSECPVAAGQVAKVITESKPNSNSASRARAIYSIAEPLTLTTGKTEARMDTRFLSVQLGKKHPSLFGLVKDHQADFEEFGKVRFETGASPNSKTGQIERFALLNEDQSYLLLTYSRNTARTRQLKVKLVKAFGEARKTRDMRSTEYLPTFHQVRDRVHELAQGSPNERHVHSNIAKLVNKVVGIESGQRAAASLPTQSLIVVAQMMIAQAMQSAHDHHDGYQLAKAAMKPLLALTTGNVLQLAVERANNG